MTVDILGEKTECSIVRSKRRTAAIEVKNGGIILRLPYFVPRSAGLAFVSSRQQWIARRLSEQRKAAALFPEPDEQLEKELREKAKLIIKEKVERYSSIMGVRCTGIKITGAKTRFGSCSAKNSLCFSFRLMQYPDDAVDYVVVHELAHIRHKDHGKGFYSFVESVMPDYRQKAALLKYPYKFEKSY